MLDLASLRYGDLQDKAVISRVSKELIGELRAQRKELLKDLNMAVGPFGREKAKPAA